MKLKLIKEIYKGLQFDTEVNTASRKQEASIYEIAKKIEGADDEEKQYIEDLFFEASGYGQEYGFWSGFRFAVRLMAECFV